MKILTKEFWCGVKGHKDVKKYTEGRREVYWECRRCGHITWRSAPGAWRRGRGEDTTLALTTTLARLKQFHRD